ncbi:MAG: hypothetical protein KDD60_04225 [Bdellovibrionales bacterium]|nr:hypothetical protein [Bdellovibrionales bacterium]
MIFNNGIGPNQRIDDLMPDEMWRAVERVSDCAGPELASRLQLLHVVERHAGNRDSVLGQVREAVLSQASNRRPGLTSLLHFLRHGVGQSTADPNVMGALPIDHQLIALSREQSQHPIAQICKIGVNLLTSEIDSKGFSLLPTGEVKPKNELFHGRDHLTIEELSRELNAGGYSLDERGAIILRFLRQSLLTQLNPLRECLLDNTEHYALAAQHLAYRGLSPEMVILNGFGAAAEFVFLTLNVLLEDFKGFRPQEFGEVMREHLHFIAPFTHLSLVSFANVQNIMRQGLTPSSIKTIYDDFLVPAGTTKSLESVLFSQFSELQFFRYAPRFLQVHSGTSVQDTAVLDICFDGFDENHFRQMKSPMPIVGCPGVSREVLEWFLSLYDRLIATSIIQGCS